MMTSIEKIIVIVSLSCLIILFSMVVVIDSAEREYKQKMEIIIKRIDRNTTPILVEERTNVKGKK